MKPRSPKSISLSILAALVLSACSTIEPVHFSEQALAEQGQADKAAAQAEVEPIVGELTLDQAIARALKFNLDRRAKMMEEALAFKQLDVAQYDMLPKLLAQAGYTSRNNDKISQSRNSDNGALSPSRFISQDRDHATSSLGLSWSMLDLGVGYYNSLQQADRALIAGEKRRKAMHLLMQEVRTAFWRAVGAQMLQAEVKATISSAEEALADARKAETERVRNPLDALRYQRQMLENLRLLEGIEQELSSARIELAALINAPIGPMIQLVEPALTVNRQALAIPLGVMEDTAMKFNADVREQHYNTRLARIETRKVMVRLFPNLSFNYVLNYDTDSYLVKNNWSEAGVQLSFNLFNLLTASTQLKMAQAGVGLADQRRVAMQMAVVAQVHLARLQLTNAVSQFDRADAIWQTDHRIAEHIKNREASKTQSKLDSVANQTAAILSLLRRYQSLAQAQASEARLQSTLGIEPHIDSVGTLTLSALTADIGRSQGVWSTLAATNRDADGNGANKGTEQ